MVIGPGLLAAIVLVTSERAIPNSAAYVLGFGVMAAIGVTVFRGVASLLGSGTDLGDPSDSGSTGTIIQLVFVGLLILLSIKEYLGRATAKPPKWMAALQTSTPRKSLRTGLIVVAIMPSDLLIMFTVAVGLEQGGKSLLSAIPFVLLTALVAAIPLLAYTLFRERAARVMPKVRDWMNENSWLVNIIVFVVFIVLILS
jgi:hypothetical protein